MKIVGTRVRPIDWDERTVGGVPYTGDLDFDGMLEAKVLWSTGVGDIRSISTTIARAMPGVAAVITAADFGDVHYIHEGGDKSDRHPLASGRIRYLGEPVAAVAADSAEHAAAAVAAIRVRYRPRRLPTRVDEALAVGAPRVHDRASGSNVSIETAGSWGDPEASASIAERWLSGTWFYPRVTHLCLEPNITVARWDEAAEKLELWTSTHAPYFIVKEVANALGLETDQVVCREVAVGGGFGSKSKISEHEVLAAKLSTATGRPIRLAFSRDEEFAFTKTRHGSRVILRAGYDTAGAIHALDAELDFDNGAYNHQGPSILGVGVKLLGSMYRPGSLTWRGQLVDTALPPGGPFRGYGSPQAAFALESLVDEIASDVGMDPIDLRLANANIPDSRVLSGSAIGSARLKECLETVRREIDWDAKKANPVPNRGIGVAAGIHGSGAYAYEGSNRSEAAIDVFDDGRVRVRFGGADAGTGQRTILAQIAAEELGVEIDDVSVLSMDSELTPFDMGAWSSRGTHMSGHATRKASVEMADRLRDLASQKLGDDDIRLAGGEALSANGSVAIGDLVGLTPDAVDGTLSHESEYVEERMEKFVPGGGPVNTSASYTFAAHAVEVEVDPDTGEVRVLDYVAAHDIGRALNPTLAEGQIIGGVVMGMGAALGEELIYEKGKLVNGALINYAVPRAGDVPVVRPFLIEGPEPAGPYDAKSVGELPVTPVAPAIANAIADATGTRLRVAPFTPDKVVAALRSGVERSHGIGLRPNRWWISFIRWLYPRGLGSGLHRWGTRFGRSLPEAHVVELTQPETVADAVASHTSDTAYLAGGTDLLLQRRQGLAAPVRLVSLGRIDGMRRISAEEGSAVEIGAGVTLARIEAELGHQLPILAEAARTIASPQIRAAATLGGNLAQAKRCWFFRNGFNCYKRGGPTCPCYAVTGDHRFYHAAIDAHRCQAVTPSDLATALVALDAEILMAGPTGERAIPIDKLYKGPGEVDLRNGELLHTVRISAAAAGRTAVFEKLRLWEGDFSVVSVAASADVSDDGVLADVRLVLGAIAPTPWRARSTERALNGVAPSADAIRRHMNRELNRSAHPLENNAWKLDAAVGLAVRAMGRIVGGGHQ